MLILTRRIGESIVIGDDIVVTVKEIKGEYVRLGVDAKREIRVDRLEIRQQTKTNAIIPSRYVTRLAV